MTAYTTIPLADIDQDSPFTQPLLTALRDNPISIAEGDATAPSVLEGAIAGGAAGGIGTYMIARRTTGTTDVAFGTTLAGSSLSPTSALCELVEGSAPADFDFITGSAQAGTWRCMGTFDYSRSFADGSFWYGATLWLRIL